MPHLLLLALGLFTTTDQDAKIKAMYMYKFVQTMQWPVEKSSDNYVIAIVGDINVYDQAKTVTKGKSVNSKRIEVVNYTSEIEMSQINVLFLSNTLSDMFESFQKEAIANSVLMVTESPGFAKKGAAINFFAKGDKLRFEMNLSTLDKSGINSSRTIRDLAKLID